MPRPVVTDSIRVTLTTAVFGAILAVPKRRRRGSRRCRGRRHVSDKPVRFSPAHKICECRGIRCHTSEASENLHVQVGPGKTLLVFLATFCRAQHVKPTSSSARPCVLTNFTPAVARMPHRWMTSCLYTAQKCRCFMFTPHTSHGSMHGLCQMRMVRECGSS